MINRLAGIYCVIVGVSMIAMWLMFYVTGSIPELETEPARILLHIFAEFATAVTLVVAGWGLLKRKGWAYQVYLLANGALLYTLIQSPGYFLQTGEIGMVGMFAVLVVTALILLIKMTRHNQ